MPRTLPAGMTASESKPVRNFRRLFKIAFKLLPGIVLRYVESDVPMDGLKMPLVDVGDGAGPQAWLAAPGISRGAATQRADLQIDTMTVVVPSTTDAPLVLPGIGANTVAAWAVRGAFDGATVDFYVFDFDSLTSTWWSRWYIEGASGWTYDTVTFTLESVFARFDRSIPRTILGEACNNVLGDQSCTVNLALYTIAGEVAASPAPTRLSFGFTPQVFASSLIPRPVTADWLDLGYVQFTSRDLAPQRKLVLTQTAGSPLLLALADPLIGVPAAGDTLVAVPGCDKSAATCQSKFNNLQNFRGFPYSPRPEDVFFNL